MGGGFGNTGSNRDLGGKKGPACLQVIPFGFPEPVGIPDILLMINFNSLTAEYDSPKQGKLCKLHDKDVRKQPLASLSQPRIKTNLTIAAKILNGICQHLQLQLINSLAIVNQLHENPSLLQRLLAHLRTSLPQLEQLVGMLLP